MSRLCLKAVIACLIFSTLCVIACENNNYITPPEKKALALEYTVSKCIHGKTIDSTSIFYIKPVYSDTGATVTVSFSTYCATEFICTGEKNNDTLLLKIKSTTLPVARCSCRYMADFYFHKDELTEKTIMAVFEIHPEFNPLCTLVTGNNR
jgi:hypothetical protein